MAPSLSVCPPGIRKWIWLLISLPTPARTSTTCQSRRRTNRCHASRANLKNPIGSIHFGNLYWEHFCPKPSGIFLSTFHQRYLIGREHLLLQGFPLNRLFISQNSERDTWWNLLSCCASAKNLRVLISNEIKWNRIRNCKILGETPWHYVLSWWPCVQGSKLLTRRSWWPTPNQHRTMQVSLWFAKQIHLDFTNGVKLIWWKAVVGAQHISIIALLHWVGVSHSLCPIGDGFSSSRGNTTIWFTQCQIYISITFKRY